MGYGHMGIMPSHDPVPPRREADVQRTAIAWQRYKRLMSWMAIAAVAAVLLALIYLKSSGLEVPIHMMIATIAGVGFSVLLGTALMGLVYFSNNSGHDDAASRRSDNDDRG
jgi:membrane protease YdiL (CAAX protease family)